MILANSLPEVNYFICCDLQTHTLFQDISPTKEWPMEHSKVTSPRSNIASKRTLLETFGKKLFEGLITIQVCETKIGSLIRL